MQFADNAGPDQPVYLPTLIRVYVSHLHKSMDIVVYVDEQNVQIRLHR